MYFFAQNERKNLIRANEIIYINVGGRQDLQYP